MHFKKVDVEEVCQLKNYNGHSAFSLEWFYNFQPILLNPFLPHGDVRDQNNVATSLQTARLI